MQKAMKKAKDCSWMKVEDEQEMQTVECVEMPERKSKKNVKKLVPMRMRIKRRAFFVHLKKQFGKLFHFDCLPNWWHKYWHKVVAIEHALLCKY